MTFGADYSGALKLVLWVHIVGGAIALAIFLVPMVTRKGGKAHTRSGWVYSTAMGALALAAIALTPWRMFFDERRSRL